MKVYDIHAPTPQGPASREKQAFLLAISFHEAALRAGTEIRAPSGAQVIALCPMIVSYAFAAELYLKSLAGFSGGLGSIRGHKLNVLYGRLAPQIRDQIARIYEAKTSRNSTALAGDLQRFAKAFNDWRYVYEGDGQQVYVNLLIAFTQATYEAALWAHPVWQVSEYQDERIRSSDGLTTMTVANVGGGTFIHMVDGTGELNKPEA